MATRSRRRFDDDDFTLSLPPNDLPPNDLPPNDLSPNPEHDPEHDPDEPSWSSYPDAAHGPQPLPGWVLTSPAAIDTDLGVMKTGKEADVSLLRRAHDGREVLMAVKRYRDAQHRMFHRDAGYLEGRRVRRSRENRAMATRTEFGRELIAGQWAAAEFAVLSRLWRAGAAVPYPVQLQGTELMMEFIGTPEGVAAPRLAQLRPDSREAAHLYHQMRQVLVALAEAGYAHGDLSAYNVLVHQGRLVLIDLPQAMDVVGNPQGFEYLLRDCVNICTWFAARGVHADPHELRDELLVSVPRA
ncbi:MAG: RIO1 family regulatory kinase/ATPase [Actinomycetota bacterium]|nr:RIO1 family regulatory kinase/ATPase [Actinomycetota bacterium]